MLPPTRTGTSS